MDIEVSFNLSIESGNAAIVEDPALAIADILSDVKRTLSDGYTSGMVTDVNGNRVGTWKLDQTDLS